MKSDKVVEAHRRSANINEVRFMKLKVERHFLKHAVPDFADELLFVSFYKNKPNGLFSNTVYEYALYSAFQLKTQKIDRSK